MNNDGHRDKFGPPAGGGWPAFDKHGKRVREEEQGEQGNTSEERDNG